MYCIWVLYEEEDGGFVGKMVLFGIGGQPERWQGWRTVHCYIVVLVIVEGPEGRIEVGSEEEGGLIGFVVVGKAVEKIK